MLESPLDCKEIQPVHPKGDQSWMFIGGTDVEAETPILWLPDIESWLIWKDPNAGKDWGQEEKETTEDEMVGWHHRLNGHGFGWTLGIGDRQGSLECCGSWGHKESDKTEQLNWTETECSARVNPPSSVHKSISFSAVSQCHFMAFLEFATNNILHYIWWPRQRGDYSGSFFHHSLFTGFMACVLCVSAVHPWMFSGLTLSCWLHTEITLKSRLFNWTQKSSNWF